MRPRKHKQQTRPEQMTDKEIRRANKLHKRMKEALRKDRESRDREGTQ